jgi:hypothetical protein
VNRSTIAKLAGAVLIAASLFNAAYFVRQSYHWPLFASDDWGRLEEDLVHAKSVLSALPGGHVEYRIEEASDTYDVTAYYRLQNIVAPTILQTNIPNRYVLVEFWTTRRARPLPGLVLVEDFGAGFALYQRSQ